VLIQFIENDLIVLQFYMKELGPRALGRANRYEQIIPGLSKEQKVERKCLKKRVAGLMELTKRSFKWNNPGEIDLEEVGAFRSIMKKWLNSRKETSNLE